MPLPDIAAAADACRICGVPIDQGHTTFDEIRDLRAEFARNR